MPHSPDYLPPRNAERDTDGTQPSGFTIAPVPEKAKRRSADAKARKQQETGPGKPRDERPIVYSIVIPRVFKNIGEKRIRAIIYKLNFGFLQRVDIVPKRGKDFNVVFLHFSAWNTNPTANAIRSRLDEGQQVKLVYEDPWFWLIKKSEATRPEDRPKREQRPAPFIDFYHKPKPTAEPKTTAEPQQMTVLKAIQHIKDRDGWFTRKDLLRTDLTKDLPEHSISHVLQKLRDEGILEPFSQKGTYPKGRGYYKLKTTQKSVTFEESTCRGGAAYGNNSYTIRVKLDAINRDVEATEALFVKGRSAAAQSRGTFNIRTQTGETFQSLGHYLNHYTPLLKPEFTPTDTWSDVEVLIDNEWVPGNRFFTLAQPSTDAPTMPFPGTPSPQTDEERAARLRYEEEERDAEEEFRRKKEMNALGI
jgi:hypothetical protein